MTDYEISKKAKLLPIKAIAKKLRIKENKIIPYGNYMAKIDSLDKKKKGKL